MRQAALSILLLSLLTFSILVEAKKEKENKKAAEEKELEEEETNSIVDEEEPEDGQQSVPLEKSAPNKDPSNGFGTDIDWVATLDEAISIALDLNKPIFLLIHKTWCGACTALKKSFNTSNKRAELVELSHQFVMVNLEDEDEPEDDIYAPDGRYIPRLFILNKKGEPLAVDNRKNYPSNHHYFPQVPDVIRAMKQGLELFERGGSRKQEGEEEDEPKGPVGKKIKEGRETKPEKKEAEKGKQKEAGGCPHAAGKAAKKAAEEAEKEKREAEKKTKVAKEKKSTGGGEEKKAKEKVETTKEGKTAKTKKQTTKEGEQKKEKTAKKKENKEEL